MRHSLWLLLAAILSLPAQAATECRDIHDRDLRRMCNALERGDSGDCGDIDSRDLRRYGALLAPDSATTATTSATATRAASAAPSSAATASAATTSTAATCAASAGPWYRVRRGSATASTTATCAASAGSSCRARCRRPPRARLVRFRGFRLGARLNCTLRRGMDSSRPAWSRRRRRRRLNARWTSHCLIGAVLKRKRRIAWPLSKLSTPCNSIGDHRLR